MQRVRSGQGRVSRGMMPFIEFLRRNVLAILLLCLIVTQFLMWRSLVSIRENVDYYSCGTRANPCRAMVVTRPE